MKKILSAAAAATMAGLALATPMTALALADDYTYTKPEVPESHGVAGYIGVPSVNGEASPQTQVAVDSFLNDWKDDPRPDDPVEPNHDPDEEHEYGTYKIIVPARIAYEGMSMGDVDLVKNYNIRVVGNIDDFNVLKLNAPEYTVNLDGGTAVKNGSELTAKFFWDEGAETPLSNVQTFTADQLGADDSNDNTPQGTTALNHMHLTGSVKDRAKFTGHLTYKAHLEDKVQPGKAGPVTPGPGAII